MTYRPPPLLGLRRAAARWLAVLAAGAALAAFAQDNNSGDPPGRVAYLNDKQGQLSVSPSGDNSWYDSVPNRPLTQGDRLWTDRNARAELYVGDVAVRMDEQTQLEISELDDQTLRLTLQQGRAQLRLRGDGGEPQQRVELGTGNVAVVLRAPGDYRVQADPQADSTQVMVAQGSATVYGDGGQSQELGNRQQAVYTGRNLAAGGAPQPLPAAFDSWVAQRMQLEEQSTSARYISRDIPGYQQLDQYGQWQNDATYGAVWYPNTVASDWAPYSDGYWAVVAPWGYTWIDRAPWGFAPSHYGRWTRIGPRWCWVPGPRQARPVYSPALVAFVGGAAGGLAVHGGRPAVGWFPLAPGDRWRPPYRASDRYIDRANRTVVASLGARPAPAYANRELPHAVTAVPTDRFGRGGPIERRDFVRPNAPQVASAQVSQRPPVDWAVPGATRPRQGNGAPEGFPGRRTQAVPPPAMAAMTPQPPLSTQQDRWRHGGDDRRPGSQDLGRMQPPPQQQGQAPQPGQGQQQMQRRPQDQQRFQDQQRQAQDAQRQQEQQRQAAQQLQQQAQQQQDAQRRMQQAQQDQAGRQQREAMQQQQQQAAQRQQQEMQMRAQQQQQAQQQQMRQQNEQQQRQQQMEQQRQQAMQQRQQQMEQQQRQQQQMEQQQRQQQMQAQQRQQQMDQQQRQQQHQMQQMQQMQQQQAQMRQQQEMQMRAQQQAQQQQAQQQAAQQQQRQAANQGNNNRGRGGPDRNDPRQQQ